MRTLAEAVALLEEADDPAALIASRGIKNQIASPRTATCPIAQFLTLEVGMGCTVTGISAWQGGSNRVEFTPKLEELARQYDNAVRDE